MIRRLILSIPLIIGLFGTQAYAVLTQQPMQLGLGLPYTFKVEEPQIITNQFMFWLKATCAITSPNSSNILEMTILRKSGSLNGSPLIAGDSMNIIVYTNDTMEITAAPGAQVQLINKGTDTINAICSIS